MTHILRVHEVKRRKDLPRLSRVHVVMRRDLNNFIKLYGYEYCNVWVYKDNVYFEPNSFTA